MGLFDYLRCEVPLPVNGANALDYQTKDTPAQLMDHYVIREDGSLWHEAYDIVDRSDPSKPGIEALFGLLGRANLRWEPESFTGEIRFYTEGTGTGGAGWLEWSAYFERGGLRCLNQISSGL